MLPPDPFTTRHELEAAIDRRPLTVTATTPVTEALTTLGKAQSSCNLSGLELSVATVLNLQARAGAVWVVEGSQLLGQFSEADALHAITVGQGGSFRPVAEVMTMAPVTYPLSAQADLFDILRQMRQHRLQQVPVVDEAGHFFGVITAEGIRGALHLDDLLKTETVTQVVQGPVQTAAVTDSALVLAQRLVNSSTDILVLLADCPHGRPKPVGIVQSRDLIQLQRLGLDLSTIPGQAIMLPHPLRLSPTTSALAAYWTMQQHPAQRFVVGDDLDSLTGTGSPTSFLYTLDIDLMAQAHQAVKASVRQFALAQAAATVIESEAVDDLQTLQKQLDCSQLLSAMALHIRQSLDLRTILQTAVNDVRQFLQSDRVLVYQLNPDLSGTVVVESLAAGWHPALNSTVQDTCFGQNYAAAYKAGRTQIVEDIYTAGLSQCHIDILVLFDVRASLVVPIIQGNHLWGLLCAYHCSGPRHWHDFEVDLLNQLATHMAIAIQQSELYHQAQTELKERQRVEQQLKTSLKEKESLLKEIHHRVKNNLQIISSVLRLQSDFIKDEQVLTLFKDSQTRIRSMALIHEKLYKSNDLRRINMDDYIRDLVSSLMPSHGTAIGEIQLNVDAKDVYLTIDSAIPCGLIIHELVSNALKHAFSSPTGENPVIRIEIKPTTTDLQYVVAVSDNGIGFPPGIDFRATESLGMELVCVFTEQLDGAIDLQVDGGTRFAITFTEADSPEGAE